MDKNLEKLLEKRGKADTGPRDPVEPAKVVAAVSGGKNAVLEVHDTPYRMSLLLSLLRECASMGRRTWMVSSRTALTPFKLFWLKSGMGNAVPSVRCPFEHTDADGVVTLWSPDALQHDMGRIAAASPEDLPAFLIIEDLEMLAEPESGPALETVLIGLPSSIGIIACMSPVNNGKEILDWVALVRGRAWEDSGVLDAPGRHVLAFWAPDHELMPLLQKKKIATRVKRILKEEPPIRTGAAKRLIQPMIQVLEEEGLLPALVLMPTRADCDAAVQHCPGKRPDKEAFSSPRVSAMFDRHPMLKNRADITGALARRVGVIHGGHHPAWTETVEILLSLKELDAVFTTPIDAQDLNARVKSIVMITSRTRRPGEDHPTPVSAREFHRIRRLVEGSDAQEAGCIVLVPGPQMEMVAVKDMDLSSSNAVESRFQCTTPAVLALASGANRGLKEGVDLPLGMRQRPSGETDRLEELLSELEELLPDPACGSPRLAPSLILRSRQLAIEIDQAEMHMREVDHKRAVKWARRRIQTLKSAAALFPCERCPHHEICRQLKYKRIRHITQEYQQLRDQLRSTASGLKLDLADETALLWQLGLLDTDMNPTPKGNLALRTGLRHPFFLAECLSMGPPWDEAFSFPVMAGFTESPADETPLPPDDWISPDLACIHEEIEKIITPAKEQLIRHAVIAPEPDAARSAVAAALQNGEDPQLIADRAHISLGFLFRLSRAAEALGRRVAGERLP